MVSHDDGNKRSEGSSQGGEKRCFDLFATLLHAFGDDEIRAKRGKEEQERNMLMIQTIINAATNTFLLGGHKRKIDHDQEKVTSSSSSRSLVEYKRRRVVESDSDDEPIRAEPIRQIKPPVKKRKAQVKQKEPVKREPGVTPGWLVKLMKEKNGLDAKMVIEKVITKTDLKADQGRFLIPFKQITEDDFLNERELRIVEEHHSGDGENKEDRPKGVDVILLNSNDVEKQWSANLRIWEMRTTFNYALCCGWNQFVRDNDLAVNQTRCLWSFHSHDGTLFLAFDPLPVAQPHAASSSSMDMVVISENPFVIEEINRSLLPYWTPRRSRTPRVWIEDPTSDHSSSNLLEGGFDLNRTPPPEECAEEMDSDLEDVQEETHTRTTLQEDESFRETSLVSFTETTVDLELRL